MDLTRFRCYLLILAMFLGSGIVLCAGDRPSKTTSKGASIATKSQEFQRDIVPLLRKYCVGCHGPQGKTAGIDFLSFADHAAVAKAHATWEKAAAHLRDNVMPPKGQLQPSTQERTKLISWIESTLSTTDCQLQDPGRVTLRRLNRSEYNNTIRDLVGVNFRPADDFPSDDVGYGFDNIGDVLSISPLLLEKYLSAAEKISEAAIFAEDAGATVLRFEAESMPETGGEGVVMENGRNLYSTGEVRVDFTFPKEGTYILRARAYGQQAGSEPAKMTLRLDGKDIETFDVPVTEDQPGVYQLRTNVTQGSHRFGAAFVNDYYEPKNPDPKNRDRNLIVDYLEVTGPLAQRPSSLPETHRRLITCEPTPEKSKDECARIIIRNFARRAFRRPVADEEVERLMKPFRIAETEGDSFERGIQIAVQAILVSPHFLFLVEKDPSPASSKSIRSLDDYELASRLSYFLWSSMPDQTLFDLADKGLLRNPKVLVEQARRMIKDPKSNGFVRNFAGQWLELRNLRIASPDADLFRSFNDELRADMRKETEMFFEAIMREDRSILDFIDGKFTFLNERLARHYGITDVKGPEFRKMALKGVERGGVLTQASVLTVTSNPTRTSPVKRGKFILEQILGTPPPPPPPNVPELKEEKGTALTGTLRQKMEQHRSNPACATCHSKMDPLGFAFENFDAVGAWRTREGRFLINAAGELPNGRKFSGPAQLKVILRSQSKQFVQCLSEKMLTYALGRGLTSTDRCAVDVISKAVIKDNYRFSELITQIVTSEPFLKRSSDGGKDA